MISLISLTLTVAIHAPVPPVRPIRPDRLVGTWRMEFEGMNYRVTFNKDRTYSASPITSSQISWVGNWEIYNDNLLRLREISIELGIRAEYNIRLSRNCREGKSVLNNGHLSMKLTPYFSSEK